ncbi:hypothetical protein CLIM01_13923 [Colletotrichum limetticola]|uniref:Uncharacterized protein n=1 Tax=Colletotrichum limetticola TaxID=1209924 RepID=A0ABQ9PB27_9PEZI|nr:hypothetical protein CLIM01_13923 [Colletotrichum limetticola]
MVTQQPDDNYDEAYHRYIRPTIAHHSTRSSQLYGSGSAYVPVTAIACLFECRNISFEECHATPGLKTTTLRQNGDVAIHGMNSEVSKQLSIHDYRAANNALVGRLHAALVGLLLLPSEGTRAGTDTNALRQAIDADLPHPNIIDDRNNTEPGGSAFTQTFNKASCPALWERAMGDRCRHQWFKYDAHERRFSLHGQTVRAYFEKVHAFVGDLLLVMFITGGVQCRVTEFLTIRHTNTVPDGRRNLFWFDSMAAWAAEIRYHKGDDGSTVAPSGWHFFPGPVSYLLTYYLLYIAPFARALAQETGAPASEDDNPFLSMARPAPQRSREVGNGIRNLMPYIKPRDLMEVLSTCSGIAGPAITDEAHFFDDCAGDDESYDDLDEASTGIDAARGPGPSDGRGVLSGNDAGAADVCDQLDLVYEKLLAKVDVDGVSGAPGNRVPGRAPPVLGVSAGSGSERRTALKPSAAGPGGWNKHMVYVHVARYFERQLRTSIGVAGLRHISEAWARHMTSEMQVDPAKMPHAWQLTDDVLSSMHQQAGHSDRIASIKYALANRLGVLGMDADKMSMHAMASLFWHRWVGGQEMIERVTTPSLLKRFATPHRARRPRYAPGTATYPYLPGGACLPYLALANGHVACTAQATPSGTIGTTPRSSASARWKPPGRARSRSTG